MRLALIVVALVLAGCSSLTRTISERDVSRAVGKPVHVSYVDREGEEGYDRTDSEVVVRMHRDWLWEPHLYQWGAITCIAADAAGVQREIAMERIGIPWRFNWGIDCNGGMSKRDATRKMAQLERTLPHSSTWQDSAPGWPTFLYTGDSSGPTYVWR